MLMRLFATHDSWGMLFVRIPLGMSMILHGYGKVMNLPGFIQYCDNIGIPPVFAVLAAFGEFLGGLGVLVGFMSRIAALGTGATMAVAAIVRHLIPGYGYLMNWHAGVAFGAEGYEFHTLAVGMSVGIMVAGAGAVSVDYYVARYLARTRSSDQELVPDRGAPVTAH